MFKPIVFILYITLISACDSQVNVTNSLDKPIRADEIVKEEDKATSPRTQARTWSEIKKSGYIIALKLNYETEDGLPRSGSTSTYHRELFESFAQSKGLKVRWLKVASFTSMFNEFKQFNADVIPRHLTITQQRQKKFNFTYPLLRDREILIGDSITPKASVQSTLSNSDEVTVHLPANSSYIESINNVFPNWTVELLPEGLNSESLADAISEHVIDYTVVDGFSFDVLNQYRNDVKNVLTLPRGIDLAWAVNFNTPALLHHLNEFISVHHVLQIREPNRTIDFELMREKGLPLRVITRNSPSTYFLWRSKLMGFEYELMKKFAKDNHVKLEMVVANSYEEMLQMLKDGRGDMIAAGLSRSAERSKKIAKAGLQSSIRYNRVNEQIVAHRDSAPINSFSDLKGRTITIRKTSSFWQTAQALVNEYGVKVVAAEESLSSENLVAMVDSKTIDLTIGDDDFLSIEKSFRDNIITPLTLKESVPYAYVFGAENPQLGKYLNQYIRKIYRQVFYNVVRSRYFNNKKRQIAYKKASISVGENLSPYDDIVRKNVVSYNFDWRLIVSQMYQESNFNPKASNPSGAEGLMQMLPRTAKELGVTNLHEPEQAISSGVKYLNWTRDRFSKDLPVQEQIFFSLASYNAGYGHVKDAQRLAKKMGLRDDKWFNNVEKAMLLLQKREYYKKARFGYVRGIEPVNYVRQIHQRYLSYIRITQ